MDREVPLAVDVLRRAGFGSQVARLLEYPRRAPNGAILVAEGPAAVGHRRRLHARRSRRRGWIGALGVAPEARRRGLGTALTEAAVRWLRARGAPTVLLYATEAGRPVYERLGFVAEERAVAWRGVAGAAPPLDLQRLADIDRAQDPRARPRRHRRAARRGPGRDPPAGGRRRAGRRSTAWRGYAIASPWGAGTAIAASTPEVGVALMAAATGGPAAGTLIVPDGNLAATDALHAWRFVRLNDALRMRLGRESRGGPSSSSGCSTCSGAEDRPHRSRVMSVCRRPGHDRGGGDPQGQSFRVHADANRAGRNRAARIHQRRDQRRAGEDLRHRPEAPAGRGSTPRRRGSSAGPRSSCWASRRWRCGRSWRSRSG